jgi:hypothetical protein
MVITQAGMRTMNDVCRGRCYGAGYWVTFNCGVFGPAVNGRRIEPSGGRKQGEREKHGAIHHKPQLQLRFSGSPRAFPFPLTSFPLRARCAASERRDANPNPDRCYKAPPTRLIRPPASVLYCGSGRMSLCMARPFVPTLNGKLYSATRNEKPSAAAMFTT